VVVVEDCYNANPMSMRAALDDLAVTASGRRVAVLGDMLELGPGSPRYHQDVGRHARRAGVDVLIAVGPESAAIAEAYGPEAHRTADATDAAAVLSGLMRAGDTVLIKASRGLALERVTEALVSGAPA
jgi:UDP-N-acetylmuramoyl-tripeptide--D-alanyl-D-alanine ligase